MGSAALYPCTAALALSDTAKGGGGTAVAPGTSATPAPRTAVVEAAAPACWCRAARCAGATATSARGPPRRSRRSSMAPASPLAYGGVVWLFVM